MSFDLTLSFDNGPEPDVTPAVLEALARHDIRTTFFVIGEKLQRPGGHALSERCAAAGHWIGNHTWTHSIPLGERSEPDMAEQEIGRTQAAIGTLAHPQKFFRPFGGGGNLDRRLLNRDIVAFLRAGGYSCVLWNSIPRDWADPDGWVDRALAHCAQQTHTLMVLHDLPTGAMRHLPRFLACVAQAGGRFRQDFPPSCVPIRAGELVGAIDPYTAG
jgi:peptidoglycan/xylan/chitin deacetylase (PgdA/CDA1 family)